MKKERKEDEQKDQPFKISFQHFFMDLNHKWDLDYFGGNILWLNNGIIMHRKMHDYIIVIVPFDFFYILNLSIDF